MSLLDGPKDDAKEVIGYAIDKLGEVVAGTILPAALDQISRLDLGDGLVVDVKAEIRIRKADKGKE